MTTKRKPRVLKMILPQHEASLVRVIAKRAVYAAGNPNYRVEDATMDLTVCHLNGCPLRLVDLAEANEFDLIHDVLGINRHLDHETGELKDCFLPRYAAPRAA